MLRNWTEGVDARTLIVQSSPHQPQASSIVRRTGPASLPHHSALICFAFIHHHHHQRLIPPSFGPLTWKMGPWAGLKWPRSVSTSMRGNHRHVHALVCFPNSIPVHGHHGSPAPRLPLSLSLVAGPATRSLCAQVLYSEIAVIPADHLSGHWSGEIA